VFTTVSAAKAAVSHVMKSGQPGIEASIRFKDVKMAHLSNGNSSGKTKTTNKAGNGSPVPPFAQTTTPTARPKFSFKPTAVTGNGADYESITLLRMRNLEKAKLEREIREEEENEAATVIE